MAKSVNFPSEEKRSAAHGFFKFFLPGVTDEHLAVPKAFFKHMEGKTSGSVSLMGPSGNIWNVDLVENCTGLFLEDGWREFVKDHSLFAGDCMIFKYNSTSMRFTVKIFDRSSCEKEDAFDVKPGCNFTCAALKKKIGEKNAVKTMTSPCQVSKSSLNCGKLKTVLNEGIQLCKIQCDHLTEKKAREQPRNKEDVLNSTQPKKSIIEGERSGALEAARSFKSEYPTTTLVMKRRHVSICHVVYFPSPFCTSWLPKVRQTMILHDPRGKLWKTTFIPANCGSGGVLSAGWKAFAEGNNLRVGDACVFELVKSDQFYVHIFR